MCKFCSKFALNSIWHVWTFFQLARQVYFHEKKCTSRVNEKCDTQSQYIGLANRRNFMKKFRINFKLKLFNFLNGIFNLNLQLNTYASAPSGPPKIGCCSELHLCSNMEKRSLKLWSLYSSGRCSEVVVCLGFYIHENELITLS
jgi:hypothetical protein